MKEIINHPVETVQVHFLSCDIIDGYLSGIIILIGPLMESGNMKLGLEH